MAFKVQPGPTIVGPINGAQLIAGSVSGPALAVGSVTANAIAANAVTANAIAANAITGKTITGGTINGTVYNGTDYVQNSSGTFFYSGTPAAGNLIASIAAASGTDAFGNNYVQGVGAYSLVNGLFAQIIDGSLNLGNIVSGTPDTTDAGFIGPAINGVLQTLGISPPISGALLNPTSLVLKAGAGSQGTGSATAPNVLIRDTSGTSAADGFISGTWIKTANGGAAYTWQSPSAAANWSFTGLQYRLTPLDEICFTGQATYTGTAITGASIFSNILSASLVAPYVPKVTQYAPVVHLTSTGVQKNIASHARVTSGGSLSIAWGDGVTGSSHDASGLANGDIFQFDFAVPLGNIS